MSVREVGSYIGYNRVTSTSQDSASGIWSLAAAERRRRAAAWPVPFQPSNLSGLQLWLDASDASTLYDATTGGSLVAADGGVARWEDKSGNARHATQSTSGDRPLRKTSVQGGKDVLRFDGTSDFMTVPSSTAAFKFLHDGDSTVFLVVKAGTSANPGHGRYTLLSNIRDGATTRVGFEMNHRDSDPSTENDLLDISVFKGLSSNYPVYSPHNNFFASGSFGVISAVLKPDDATSGNRVSLRRNGSAASTTNSPAGASQSVSTANADQDLNISRRPGQDYPADGFVDGDYCEIIMYDTALSDADREKVENYLLAKWGIAPAPVPQTIPGLQLWLDASDADTLYDATSGGSLVAADGSVARWEDKSGNARHATEATAGNRPTRKTSQQNGKDTLLFDGTNDKLTSTDFLDLSSGQAMTVFVVAKRNATGSMHSLVTKFNQTGDQFTFDGWRFRLDDTNKLNAAFAKDGNETIVASSSTVTASDYSLWAVKATVGSLSSAVLYRNGTSLSVSSTGSVQTLDNTSYNVMVGSMTYLGDHYEFLSGNIGEIIMYNSALSDTDREAVEDYLLAKWAIA